MKTNITAKNMVVTPAITNRIVRKTETMSRYLKPDTEMFVRLEKKKNRRVVEITVPLQGVTLRAEATSDDNLFMGIDQALAKLEKQILKHRTKLSRRLREDANVSEMPEFIEHLADEEKEERKVVRQKTYTVRPMSLEDAILQMEMLGHTFFVYVDMDTERTHVLYLRKDGQLGLLEPEA
jgi:putative sigma-54 modulation protein